jgi:UDP-N-acetylmuramoylalanine--D-glutamate ligase
MQEAVKMAVKLAQKHDNVLLSPACASFDMYANFEERGDDFVNSVRQLVI